MRRWLDESRVHGIALDRRWALALHRGAERPRVLWWLIQISRVGDGPLWLSMLVLLPTLDRRSGWNAALQLLELGALNLCIYWALKRSTRRDRPYQQCDGIRACAHSADRFSFPSGHTLHAVSFATLLSGYYPGWAPLLWCFAMLVAVSRIVLGLHYPSDVLAGVLIGVLTGAGLLLAR